MDLERLRHELHRSVDEAVNRAQGTEAPYVAIEKQSEFGPWEFRWPSGAVELFTGGSDFLVRRKNDALRVRVARTTRRAWGRERDRAIVFGARGDGDAARYYPWTEFVGTDDDRMAATIPRPGRPRASARDGDVLPGPNAPGDVERADSVFTGITDGPSLRLVVSAGDDNAMVQHGVHVAELRRRV